MMRRRMSAVIGSAAILLAMPGVPAASAAQVSPNAPDYVIVYPSEAVTTSRGTFYPTGPVDEDTIVVIANEDGTLPGGLTEAQVRELAAGGSAARAVVEDMDLDSPSMASDVVMPMASHSYAAVYNKWSIEYSGANIWGYDSSTRVSYTFSVTEGTNQQATARGLGYYYGYNGSELGYWAQWYALGLASDGSPGGAQVPWGAVIATAKFKAMSTVLHLAIGYFTP